jgi:hypothetical protein
MIVDGHNVCNKNHRHCMFQVPKRLPYIYLSVWILTKMCFWWLFNANIFVDGYQIWVEFFVNWCGFFAEWNLLGIESYTGQSVSLKVRLLWSSSLAADLLYVILFYEDLGSIPTRNQSLNHYLQSCLYVKHSNYDHDMTGFVSY